MSRRHLVRKAPTPDIKLEDFKASLGRIAAGYTDAELRQLDADLEILAGLLLDLYLDKHRCATKPRTAIDTSNLAP
jgi:hypothetical protein